MTFGVTTPEFAEGCAVVFGGSGGLGRASAGLMAERGSDIVVTYKSRPADAESLVAELQKMGRKASAMACDVTDRKQVEAVFEHAVATYKRVHTVVSAGGLVFGTGPLSDFKEEAFKGVIETDVYGFYNIAQVGAPILRQGKGGSFVALVTSAVSRTVPHDALSATPKAAVTMMVRQLAHEEAAYGIRANAVGPGVINAGMVLPMMQTPTKALLEAATDVTPLKRWGEASEIAEAVAFLASSKASYITGQVLMVDGGLAA
ncbi:Versicolorin reductase 1 [Apiospora kogelbergensis]|uniref:Versicolorin reductase 1 n=1 Tax=Apiospora kogelbergensis TaxID=1337665 RepID=A0AAW0QDR4_9PEZI